MVNENFIEHIFIYILFLILSESKLFVFGSITLIIKENSVNDQATLHDQHDFALLIDPLRFHSNIATFSFKQMFEFVWHLTYLPICVEQ